MVALARRAQGSQLETLLYSRSAEVLAALLDNPRLGEQHLTLLLARKDLAREIVLRVAENKQWMKSYPLKTAILKHPRTPRHIAIPLLKFIYPFDLLEIAATPGAAPDLKRLVEDSLLAQRESLALGQRLTLARRGTHRICGALLSDSDSRVIRSALDNPSLTEQAVAAALLMRGGSSELPVLVAEHRRWASLRGVRLALLRNEHLSLARFAAMLPELSLGDLNDLARDPRLAANLRSYVSGSCKDEQRKPNGTRYTEVSGWSLFGRCQSEAPLQRRVQPEADRQSATERFCRPVGC
jgi:hypothetical protein